MTSLLISSEDNFDIRVHTCPTFVSLMVGYNFAPIVCVRDTTKPFLSPVVSCVVCPKGAFHSFGSC